MSKKLMLVGTGSTVGKSVLCAAFCRIFAQEGWSVTPFKSQNMSNNSYITADGREMGRAQVMQAECAGKAPDARMNPILLKPASDRRSQLVFNGKVRDTLDAREFYAMKDELRGDLLAIFDELAANCDLMVLEGAGSPAEINLKENDLVNMGMAKMAQAPTLLVGDIDKGGVFASLYGTVMLLDPDERALIKGFLINKFRGDPALLEDGLRQIEELTGIPVLGVIPYFDLTLDDEDSADALPRFRGLSDGIDAGALRAMNLDVAFLQIPYLSNFTDVNALALEPGVTVRFVEPGEALGQPDLIVIPGSKSTIHAAQTLKDKGCFEQIRAAHAAGSHVFGICGGYQILGTRIEDPLHSESERDGCDGIGLLDVETIFSGDKTTTLSAGTESRFATTVKGYEIHMGEQRLAPGTKPFLTHDDGSTDGAISADGRVIGTYYHGIFDNGAFTRALVNAIRAETGRPVCDAPLVDYAAFKQSQYDKLADHVRQHVDMDAIRHIIEAGV